jgi:uncharacterized protein
MAQESLNLRLTGLPVGHTTHHGELEFVAVDAAEEAEPYAVRVTSEVHHLGTRLHVRSTVSGHATSTCHRCLKSFARPVAAEFELTLERGTAGDGEEIVGVPENAPEYDLAPYVREAVLLEEPIRTLCADDCKGLCPQCGAELNSGPCGCGRSVDPRWAPLDGLRGQF